MGKKVPRSEYDALRQERDLLVCERERVRKENLTIYNRDIQNLKAQLHTARIEIDKLMQRSEFARRFLDRAIAQLVNGDGAP